MTLHGIRITKLAKSPFMPRLTWFATQAEKKLGCNPLHSASEAMQLVFTGSTLISFGIICAILADLKSITFMWLMFTLGGTCIAGTLFKRLKVRKFTRTLEFIGNTIRAVGLVPSALYDELHDDDLLIDEVFELFKKTLHRIAVQIVIWEKRDDGLAMDNARVQRELFTKFHKTAALFGINLGPYGEYYKTAVPDLKTPEANTEETTA